MDETNDSSDVGCWMALLSHTFLDLWVFFSCKACDLQMAVVYSIHWKKYKDVHYYIILHFSIFSRGIVSQWLNLVVIIYCKKLVAQGLRVQKFI